MILIHIHQYLDDFIPILARLTKEVNIIHHIYTFKSIHHVYTSYVYIMCISIAVCTHSVHLIHLSTALGLDITPACHTGMPHRHAAPLTFGLNPFHPTITAQFQFIRCPIPLPISSSLACPCMNVGIVVRSHLFPR